MRRLERAVKNSRISRFITDSFLLVLLVVPVCPWLYDLRIEVGALGEWVKAGKGWGESQILPRVSRKFSGLARDVDR
jgi:hypothetical protein